MRLVVGGGTTGTSGGGGGGGGGKSLTSDTSGATLLVCHGSLGQALLCTALGLGESAWRTHEFPNCGLVEIEWPEEAPRASRWRWRLPAEGEWQTE